MDDSPSGRPPAHDRSSCRRCAFCLAFWLVAGLFGSSAFAARINVQIRLPAGLVETPDVMRVTLETVNGGYVLARTLHAETNVILDRISNGQYILSVESPGFETGSQWIDVNAPYARFEMMVILTLGPRIGTAEESADHPPSGDQTVEVERLVIPPEALEEMQKGEKEAQKSKPEKAAEHFEKAVSLCPECHQAFEQLGMQYAALQKWPEAIAALEKSLELHPENPKGRRNLAQLYLSQDRADEAVEQLDYAAGLEERNSKTLRLLGEAYLGLADCEMALDYFLAASELSPEDHSHLGIGQCYLELGKGEEGLAELKEFIKRNPRDPRTASVQQFVKQLEKELLNSTAPQ